MTSGIVLSGNFDIFIEIEANIPSCNLILWMTKGPIITA